MNNVTGVLYRVRGNLKTKRDKVKPGTQCYAIVRSKRHVFRQLWKDKSDGASLLAGGRLFQACAVATRNT